jgi:hypothetical protein
MKGHFLCHRGRRPRNWILGYMLHAMCCIGTHKEVEESDGECEALELVGGHGQAGREHEQPAVDRMPAQTEHACGWQWETVRRVVDLRASAGRRLGW